MSPEENELLNSYVRASGIEKQEYLIHRALQTPVTVVASPKVYFNLKNELESILEELKKTSTPDSDVLARIDFMGNIIDKIIKTKEINNHE